MLAGSALIGTVLWLAFPERTDPDRLWAEAERAFLSGDWQRARSALRRLERLRPMTGLDLVLEAQLASADGDADRSLDALGRVPDTHPIAPQAHLMAGRLHRQRKSLPKAEAELRKALQLKPRLVEAHKELIYILGIQSRRREVDAEFRELARLTRLSHHDLFTWALTHFTRWSPDIVADLDSFIVAEPEDRLSRLAVVELLLERPGDEVDSYIERILRPLSDTDPDALALRINFAFNRGRYAEAERLLAGAPGHHPRLARIRGEMALRRHDLDSAIAHFNEALSDEPYDRVSPMQLAQALKLKGQAAAAKRYLDRVGKLNKVYNQIVKIRNPEKGNAISDLGELGKSCEDAGLLDEARGWYTLAIAMNPVDSESQKALARLGKSSDLSP
jgi:tetratricopeptide (TPR) repeat protein